MSFEMIWAGQAPSRMLLLLALFLLVSPNGAFGQEGGWQRLQEDGQSYWLHEGPGRSWAVPALWRGHLALSPGYEDEAPKCGRIWDFMGANGHRMAGCGQGRSPLCQALLQNMKALFLNPALPNPGGWDTRFAHEFLLHVNPSPREPGEGLPPSLLAEGQVWGELSLTMEWPEKGWYSLQVADKSPLIVLKLWPAASTFLRVRLGQANVVVAENRLASCVLHSGKGQIALPLRLQVAYEQAQLPKFWPELLKVYRQLGQLELPAGSGPLMRAGLAGFYTSRALADEGVLEPLLAESELDPAWLLAQFFQTAPTFRYWANRSEPSLVRALPTRLLRTDLDGLLVLGDAL